MYLYIQKIKTYYSCWISEQREIPSEVIVHKVATKKEFISSLYALLKNSKFIILVKDREKLDLSTLKESFHHINDQVHFCQVAKSFKNQLKHLSGEYDFYSAKSFLKEFIVELKIQVQKISL